LPIARKAAVSLLICVLLFAGFCFVSFTSLFDKIETQFYDRAILNRLTSELDVDAAFIGAYMDELQQRFSDILNEKAIRNSFWVNQNNEDIYERSRIFASLGISLPGLQWARFIDSAGNRIHYSTNPDDQILTSTGTILYKNYPEVSEYAPFDQQLHSGMNTQRIVFDAENERLIFYYPFYDSMDINRGEALFSVSINAFSERLMENTQITARDSISVISNPNGIAIGIPPMDTVSVKEAIASVWATGSLAFSRIHAPNAGANSMALLSVKTSQGIFIGRVAQENLFALPGALKALMIGAVFVTMFVLLFFIFNMKPDAVAIVQNRLKELQVSLMNEYYQLMGDMDWSVWRRELEQRRNDVKEELCRGVKIKKGGDVEGYINSFFNKSWDALLAAIGSRTGMITTFDEAKLESILSRVLSANKQSNTKTDNSAAEDEEAGDVEELEDLSDAEEILLEEEAGGGLETTNNDAPPRRDNAAGEFDEIEELEEAGGLQDTDETPPPAPRRNDSAAGKFDEIEELEEADGLQDADETPETLTDEVAASDNEFYDVEELEEIDENGKGPYDVEEFEEVDPRPAAASIKPASTLMPPVSGYVPDADKIFEDYLAYPKTEFNNITLRAYTPASLYITESATNQPPEKVAKITSGTAAAVKPQPRAAVNEDVPEIGGGGDEPAAAKPQPRAAVNEDVPEIGGGGDEPAAAKPQTRAAVNEDAAETRNDAANSNTEDTAWLKLAGETAVLEPNEIWEELSEEQEGEPSKPKSAKKPVSVLFSGILEEDPFGSEAFKTSDKIYHSGSSLDTSATAYGEFISFSATDDTENKTPDGSRAGAPANTPKPALSADPLYHVEEFFEADESAVIVESTVPSAPLEKASIVDNYTFEARGKGMDINEIARKIDSTPASSNIPQDEPDMDISLASPANELFLSENAREETEVAPNGAPPKPSAPKSAAKVPPKKPAPKAAAKATPKRDAVHRSNAAPNYPYSLFFQNSGELEYLEPVGHIEEKNVIKKSLSGVDYINPAALKNPGVNVDPTMKNLVDSVLSR
jgi:hypothetical protein